jgi:ankyrin repeat protein
MVSLLIAAGADIESESVSGQTALDYSPTTMRNYIKTYAEEMERDPTTRRGRKLANGTR